MIEHVDTYVSLLERLDLRLIKAIDTHIHADHVTGLGRLRDITKCVTVMGEKSGVDVVSMRVQEDEKIDVDGIELTTLYTPGHTDDSYSFVGADRVFTGDALSDRRHGPDRFPERRSVRVLRLAVQQTAQTGSRNAGLSGA